MTTLDTSSSTFWLQNRLVVAVILTIFLFMLIGLVVLWHTNKSRLNQLLLSRHVTGVIKIIRFLVLAGSVLCLALSLHPRNQDGLGGLLYFILWPLIILLGALAVLPWEKFVIKNPMLVVCAFGAYLFFTIHMLTAIISYSGY